jgi:hypothetical protein
MNCTDANCFKILEIISAENDRLNKTGEPGFNIKTSQEKLHLSN